MYVMYVLVLQGPHKDGCHGWHATRQFSMPPVKFQAITIVATRQFLTTLIVATRQLKFLVRALVSYKGVSYKPILSVFIDQFFDSLAYLQNFRNLAIEMRAHLLGFFEEVSNSFLFGNVSLLFYFPALVKQSFLVLL